MLALPYSHCIGKRKVGGHYTKMESKKLEVQFTRDKFADATIVTP